MTSSRHSSPSTESGQEIRDGSAERRKDIILTCGLLKHLTFVSDPLRRTYEELRLPIYIAEPGCWLSAPFGEGKTVAMEYCARALEEEIPGLPVFVINQHVLPGNELKSFFIRALIESMHCKPTSSQSDILRNRLACYWAELSNDSPLKSVVLFLDEGQAIRSTDELLLKDLMNQISLENGALQIFTFGESPSLDLLVEQRKFKNRSGAVDRLFGGHQLRLHTYKSEADWKSLFEQMDCQRFEFLKDRTVCESLFCHLDISKYALKDESPRFWKALTNVRRGKVGTLNLRRIFVGIRHALMTAAIQSLNNRVASFDGISEKQWIASLQYGCVSDRESE